MADLQSNQYAALLKEKMGEENNEYKRPKWLKRTGLIFVIFVIVLFSWLGFMVLTGEEDGPIPEKYKTIIAICLWVSFLGGVLIGLTDAVCKGGHWIKHK